MQKEEQLQKDSATIAVEKADAEQALSEAIPALEEAAAALNDLKRDDITEIRSFAKPHILVQKVGSDQLGGVLAKACTAHTRGLGSGVGTAPSVWSMVCMHGMHSTAWRSAAPSPLDWSPDLVQVCECVVILRGLKDVSWLGAKSMMADPGFLKSLVEFDKDSLTDKQVGGSGNWAPHKQHSAVRWLLLGSMQCRVCAGLMPVKP